MKNLVMLCVVGVLCLASYLFGVVSGETMKIEKDASYENVLLIHHNSLLHLEQTDRMHPSWWRVLILPRGEC